MKFIKKHKGKIFIIIFIIFTFYTVIDTYSLKESKSETKEETQKVAIKKQTKENKESSPKVLVDVKGEVQKPGVYELTKDNTVIEAINKAGGITSQSDTSNINLSKKLEDEMVIIVYSKEEIENMNEEVECPPCNDVCVTKEDEKALLEETKEQEVIGKVNINEADMDILQTLNGIGEVKAKAIIDYRDKNGPFKQIEDLKKVSGIGDSVYEKIKDNITV